MSNQASIDVAGELNSLGRVLAGSQEFLRLTYRDEDSLFPYSTRQSDWVSDYDHPQTIRYTINSLLGLQESVHRPNAGLTTEQVDAMVTRFVDLNFGAIHSAADLGLLLVLLANADGKHGDLIDRTVVRTKAAAHATSDLNMQDLAWVMWGACAAARRGISDATPLAQSMFSALTKDFVHPVSGLPMHRSTGYRKHLVSFGSLVYFLRAVHEYDAAFDDPEARRLFENGVSRAIGTQGPLGEWPWMIDVARGAPMDFYPVFSVHQDSMAHLFLLPALELGMAGTNQAIVSSWDWIMGRNELGIPMFQDEPFFAYRSIERDESAPRVRRYVRATSRSLIGGRPSKAPGTGARVRLNDECRSYHPGWILYVWSRLAGSVS